MAHATADEPSDNLASQAYQIVDRYDGSNRSGLEQELRNLLGSDPAACKRYFDMLDEDGRSFERAGKNEPRLPIATTTSHASPDAPTGVTRAQRGPGTS